MVAKKGALACLMGKSNGETVNLWLNACDVKVSVRADVCAEVTVVQTFCNHLENPVTDGKFSFPLIDGVAVFEFEARFADKTIRGELKGKEQAKEEFVAAVAAGKKAALLEEKEDAFECSLGTLAPLSKVQVTLKYAQQLSSYSSKELAFILPQRVAPFREMPFSPPKKGPNWQCARCPFGENRWMFERCAVCGVRRPLSDEEKKQQETAALKPGPTKMSVSFSTEAPRPFSKITVREGSEQVVLDTKQNGNTHTGVYTRTQGLHDKLEIIIAQVDGSEPGAILEYCREKRSLSILMSFLPKASMVTSDSGAGGSPAEFIFVADRSGSMYGSGKTPAVKHALGLFIRSMLPGSAFNMMSFNNSTQKLWPHSAAVTESNMDQAQAWVDSLGPGGGTNISAPLATLLAGRKSAGKLSRHVIFLTDGMSYNTADAILKAKQLKASSPVPFTLSAIGLGSGFNETFLRELSEACQGKFYDCRNCDAATVTAAVVSIVEDGGAGELDRVECEWRQPEEEGMTPLRQVPSTLTPVAIGRRYFMYGQTNMTPDTFDRLARGEEMCEVELRARGPNTYLNHTFEARFADATEGLLVNRLAAHRMLKEMQANNAQKRLILFHSLRFGFASSEASFVAVESDEVQPMTPSVEIEDGDTDLIPAVADFEACFSDEKKQLSVEQLLQPVAPLNNGDYISDDVLMAGSTSTPSSDKKAHMVGLKGSGISGFVTSLANSALTENMSSLQTLVTAKAIRGAQFALHRTLHLYRGLGVRPTIDPDEVKSVLALELDAKVDEALLELLEHVRNDPAVKATREHEERFFGELPHSRFLDTLDIKKSVELPALGLEGIGSVVQTDNDGSTWTFQSCQPGQALNNIPGDVVVVARADGLTHLARDAPQATQHEQTIAFLRSLKSTQSNPPKVLTITSTPALRAQPPQAVLPFLSTRIPAVDFVVREFQTSLGISKTINSASLGDVKKALYPPVVRNRMRRSSGHGMLRSGRGRGGRPGAASGGMHRRCARRMRGGPPGGGAPGGGPPGAAFGGPPPRMPAPMANSMSSVPNPSFSGLQQKERKESRSKSPLQQKPRSKSPVQQKSRSKSPVQKKSRSKSPLKIMSRKKKRRIPHSSGNSETAKCVHFEEYAPQADEDQKLDGIEAWQAHRQTLVEQLTAKAQTITINTGSNGRLLASQERLADLARLQAFNGAWYPHTMLLGLYSEIKDDAPIHRALSEYPEEQSAAVATLLTDSQCLATLLALWYLSTVLAEMEQEWRLIHVKGQIWLQKQARILGLPQGCVSKLLSTFLLHMA